MINLIYDRDKMINKKILSTNIDNPYPFAYIILDSNEAIVFEEDMDYLNEGNVIRILRFNETIREEFYKHKVISEELRNTLIEEKQKRKELAEKNAEKMDYELYLKLKKKYESN